MEEQKLNKKVKMDPAVKTKETPQDMEGSLIEELQKWDKDKLIQQVVTMNRQLYSQDNYMNRLKGQMKEMQDYLSNKRVDYLFKVVEITRKSSASEYACFTKDFVENCIEEIQELLTIPEQTDEQEIKKN